MMAAKTDRDHESDQEFEERISEELRTFYFPKFIDVAFQLEHELSKKRFERAEKIFDIMLDENRFDHGDVFGFLQGLTMIAFRLMPAAEPGYSEMLEFINNMSSHFGLERYVSHCAQKRVVVRQASLVGGGDIVNTPLHFAENSFVPYLGSELCCTLIRASARGDLEKVKRCLEVEEDINKQMFCDHIDESAARVAAQYGHTHIVEALFSEMERRAVSLDSDLRIAWLRQDVLNIACRSGDLEMAVSMLRARNDVWDQLKLLCPHNLLRPEDYCTTDILKKFVLVMRESLDDAGDKRSPSWLKKMLENAIRFRSLPHVETVLDEMDPNQSGKIFTDHPWLMDAIFRSRCASILRCVLLRYPEVFINDATCDPVVVINDYYWPTGARLLVEAGAKCKGRVPAEHAGILTPSLEVRCRIVVRRSLKSPLSENVEKLPLPAKVKRRLLYQWS